MTTPVPIDDAVIFNATRVAMPFTGAAGCSLKGTAGWSAYTCMALPALTAALVKWLLQTN
ncbi:hypothetical protein [Rhodoferax antarcticus]|uniref:Putative signal peptidase II n=1 Tax=Rhodoferax antarcticus ANT.BR TaxID=1111071 RepID=A0A1Q8YEU6_9BURK|nr:hypothetical protein [Rhodoferax antarcticus]APW46331.1 hypothetical protein RA876_08020 [Rhodoferax antarcticus]MCW2312944.1 hypothetical protein [Rhodoferax antarcticus]OLP06553.1 putative signal peptidase II [Rhodoferax antarcticus ANT.BR]